MFTPETIIQHLLFHSCAFVLVILTGCVTDDDANSSEDELPSSYTLEMGELEEFEDPLPNRYKIWLNTFKGTKLQARNLRYEAWDINKDGKVDYLVQIDDQGRVVSRSYDFNMDGELDVIKKISPLP